MPRQTESRTADPGDRLVLAVPQTGCSLADALVAGLRRREPDENRRSGRVRDRGGFGRRRHTSRQLADEAGTRGSQASADASSPHRSMSLAA